MADENVVSDPFDPNRCKGNSYNAQCLNKAVPGSTFCHAHRGYKAVSAAARNNLNTYRLTQFASRIDELSNSGAIKNLVTEIAITKMILENILNHCKGPTDLILYSDKIQGLLGTVEKLVNSCHKLDLSLGFYLDQTQAMNLVETILKEINSLPEISDDTKEKLSDKIMKALDESKTQQIKSTLEKE